MSWKIALAVCGLFLVGELATAEAGNRIRGELIPTFFLEGIDPSGNLSTELGSIAWEEKITINERNGRARYVISGKVLNLSGKRVNIKRESTTMWLSEPYFEDSDFYLPSYSLYDVVYCYEVDRQGNAKLILLVGDFLGSSY